MIDQLNHTLTFYQTALKLREQRQALLASNIANADTPHYKARDIDFATALARAAGPSQPHHLESVSLRTTHQRHIPGLGLRPVGLSDPLYRIPYQPSLDGNTVEMDVERVQFADNTMHQQASLQVVSQRIKTLLAAVQS